MPANPQQQARASVARTSEPDRIPPSQALTRVTQEIDSRLALVRASAAAGISPDRLKLVALTAFTRNPSLLQCDPVSVARAIVEAGQLGLEPTGLLGGAYLVPRGNQATLLVGYKGLVILAMRSGLVQRVEARVVRQRDVFDYEYGLQPRLVHKPSTEVNPGDYTAAYAVIFYRDGSTQFDVMSIAEVEAIRKRSSSPERGPWVTDYAEMVKKTPLRRLMKLAPLSVEVAAALDDLDPEEGPGAITVSDPRDLELRGQLQAQLEREYGTSPNQPAQLPATTHGAGAGTPSTQAPAALPAPVAQQVPAAGATPAAAPAATQPETVDAPVPAPQPTAPVIVDPPKEVEPPKDVTPPAEDVPPPVPVQVATAIPPDEEARLLEELEEARAAMVPEPVVAAPAPAPDQERRCGTPSVYTEGDSCGLLHGHRGVHRSLAADGRVTASW